MMTRRQVATYLAGNLNGPNRELAVARAAAWLSQGRRRQAAYLSRDVAHILADRGYLAATATSARPLDAGSQAELTDCLRRQTGATDVELSTVVDPAVIGGVRLETPTHQTDQTVARRLQRLQGERHA